MQFNIDNPQDGVYYDVSIDDYHANKTHLSSSTLKEGLKSMRHLWFKINNEEIDRKSHFDMGNAMELALMDWDEFCEKVAVWDDEDLIEEIQSEKEVKRPTATKKYRDAKGDWSKENEDKYQIDKVGKESFQSIQHVLEATHKDSTVQKALNGIEAQVSIFWTCKRTGLKLKTRPDILKIKKNNIIDVKTCLDAHPIKFARQCQKLHYPFQAMLQIDGCLQSGLLKRVNHFYWLAIEKVEPYCVQLYEFDESDRVRLWDGYENFLSRVKEAMDMDFWPGYTDLAAEDEHTNRAKFGVMGLPLSMYYEFYKKF